MKLFGASIIDSVKKLVLLSLRIIYRGNKKIVNKNIQQYGDKNVFVGGDFITNRYKLEIVGTIVDDKKMTVRFELFKVYENGEKEIIKDAYWSMFVPNTRGGWIYDYDKHSSISWSEKDTPFTEIAASLFPKDLNRSEDMAHFTYNKFLEIVKNEQQLVKA